MTTYIALLHCQQSGGCRLTSSDALPLVLIVVATVWIIFVMADMLNRRNS